MKKILSVIVSFVILISVIGGLEMSAYAEVLTGYCGENANYIIDSSKKTLTISGSGRMKDISDDGGLFEYYNDIIEEIVINDGITSIGEMAFRGLDILKRISIPNSIISIGDFAFSGCESLSSITIPKSVTSIGRYAFSGCKSISSIAIPDSITRIKEFAFMGCENLSKITVDKNNSIYDSRSDCNAIIHTVGNRIVAACNKTVMPNSVTSIGEGAFSGCKSLTTIRIPNSVTSIGNYAFYDCTGLVNIELPFGLISVGSSAFENCNSLKNVIIPNSVKSIDTHAFKDCNSLTTISLSSSMTSISAYLFWNCSDLTNIIIPNSVNSIDSSAFVDCTELNNITIPDSVTSIGDYAFKNTKYYNIEENWENDVLYIAKHLIVAKNTVSQNYTVKQGTKTIAGGAFRNNVKLTSVKIPNSVTNIGSYAFSYCTSLTTINIPDSVENIDSGAFSGCTSITSISIPSVITSINPYTFYKCSNLISITIPDSVASIGYESFGSCKKLSSVTIPNSVKSIDIGAFHNCNLLKDVYYVGSEVEWASMDIAGGNNDGLNNVTIHYLRHEHEYNAIVLVPTCENEGFTKYTCLTCGDSFTTNNVPAKGHKYERGKEQITECGAVKQTIYVCAVCGDTKITEEVIGKHKWKLGEIIDIYEENDKLLYKSYWNCCCGAKHIKFSTVEDNTFKLQTVTLSKSKYVYDGKTKTPQVSVTVGNGCLIDEKNYSTYYDKGRKNVGQYYVKVTLNGYFSGTKKSYFTIVPKSTELKTVKSVKQKQIKVTWKKQATQTTGYQIQYSTNSKFKNSKTVTIKSNKTTSKTIKKLKGGKKYYIRLRTYKTVKGIKYYSAWSKSKSVKTKN